MMVLVFVCVCAVAPVHVSVETSTKYASQWIRWKTITTIVPI
jgi:hypothetical protein